MMSSQAFLVALASVLAVVAGAAVFLWLRVQRDAKAMRQALAEAKKRLETSDTERQLAYDTCTKLKTDLRAQRAHTYLTRFQADTFYKLLAKGHVELGESPQSYGLVSLQSGVVVPFLTDNDMEHLQADDSFTSVHGHLVKLEPGMVEVAPPQAPVGEGVGPEVSGEDNDVQSDDTGATRIGTAEAGASSMPGGFVPEDEDDSARTVMFSPDALSSIPEDPNQGLPYLKVQAGNDKGAVYFLPFGSSSIGRAASNTVTLNDSVASRQHCSIGFENRRFVLRDNNSTNGTYRNGEKIHTCPLELGDRIKVADTELLFTCEGYELKEKDPECAAAALEASLRREPEFIAALKLLAFLLERNVARRREAKPLWDRVMQLEKLGRSE
jgi:hypothetical protein